MKTKFCGGVVVCGDEPISADVVVEDGIITSIGECDDACDHVVDCTGLYLFPGMIDTHTHGFCGTEFSSVEQNFENGLMLEAGYGVTGVVPTTRCLEKDVLISAIKNIVREKKAERHGARIHGIHLEGPFVSPEVSGSLDKSTIFEPSVELAGELLEAGEGLIKIVSLAPEREGAEAVIEFLTKRGVSASIAHTNAKADEAYQAVEHGAYRATHTFNAMRPFRHRDVGVLGVVLTDDRVTCEMICDLVHLSKETIDIIIRCKGVDKICAISDSGVMSGYPDGVYHIAGKDRYVVNGECRLADGTIAGSCKTLYDGAKNLFSMGVDICSIAKMTSKNPAKAVGVENEFGSIEVGKHADIVLLDEKFNIKGVYIDGKVVER